ncbi:hypothetical protein ABWW58_05335 [Sporolactobacillus sp. STCC-11]|uniref:hypothetical protein n=1 Tax=Sporolactobacillus caesalpiniae TaxID=3230362 RepID=UPI0033930320
MKKIDWFFSLFLIIMGLTCLLFSANAFGHESIIFFVKTLLQMCMWFACPAILALILYLWFLFRNKNK